MESDNETILQCVMNAYVRCLRDTGLTFGHVDHQRNVDFFNNESPNLKLEVEKFNNDPSRLIYYARANSMGQFYRSPFHPFAIREQMLKITAAIPDSFNELFLDRAHLSENVIMYQDPCSNIWLFRVREV